MKIYETASMGWLLFVLHFNFKDIYSFPIKIILLCILSRESLPFFTFYYV